MKKLWKCLLNKKIEENKDEALIQGLKEDLLGRNKEKKTWKWII